MNKIDKKGVESILNNAMLYSKEDEIDDYINSLNSFIDEIKDIKDINIDSEDIMVSPITNVNCYNDKDIVEMVNKEEILKSVPNKEDDYILVPKVIE